MQACRRGVHLPEPLEQMRPKRRIDALSRVPDDDFGLRIEMTQFDVDPAAGRGELDGVGQEIPDNLLQPVRVAGDSDSAT